MIVIAMLVLCHTVHYVKLIMFVLLAIHLLYHHLMELAVCVFLDLFRAELVAVALKVKFNQIILAYPA